MSASGAPCRHGRDLNRRGGLRLKDLPHTRVETSVEVRGRKGKHGQICFNPEMRLGILDVHNMKGRSIQQSRNEKISSAYHIPESCCNATLICSLKVKWPEETTGQHSVMIQ